jgi:uncharacterized membrane protein YuzA (DUF378 family)
MATMASPTHERRHIPDRRTSQTYASERSGAAAMNMSSGAGHAADSGVMESSRAADRSRMQKTGSRMNALDWIAMALLIIGGLNWGAVGLFETDVVARIFGDMTPISRAIYVLVGLSALYSIYTGSKMGRSHE